MKERNFDEMIAYFNRRVSEMDIAQDYKMELLGMVTALGYKHEKTAQQWIACSERLPEEKDAGFLKKLDTNKRSDYVIATVEVKGERMTVTACTYDGVWDWNMKYAFPEYKIIAWQPLPDPWEGEE